MTVCKQKLKVIFGWALACMLTFPLCLTSRQASTAEQNMAATALNIKHTELSQKLRNNQFQRELYMTSTESPNDLKGEIYGVVDYPFATVNSALNKPENWCDVLILHINVKYCYASSNKASNILTVNIGGKGEQSLASAHRIEFNYQGVTTSADYFSAELNAKDGPLGTHDYHIWIEAIPLDNGHSFLHFTYAYAFGLPGRIAMQGYLATLGLGKVGFTVSGKMPDGQPQYIKGVRGVVERNTMRYYLAIDAYLSAWDAPQKDQLDKRLQQWYSSTEQYATQLHEVERIDYINMKYKEYARQQIAP